MIRLVIVLLALAVVPAHANVGKRTSEGTRGSEPTGLHDIAIEHEQLGFDFRPLAAGDNARVSVTYQLDNKSAATVTAALVFVSGSHVEHDVVVTFDRAPVLGDLATQQELPPAWKGPVSTPALDGDGTLGYETGRDVPTAFTLTIPPGRHELAVTYDAVPQRNRRPAGGTLVYQLGYVLAPARDWGAFGTLDVTIDVPAGWRVAVAPALARTGDTLHAQFTGLPADTIGITLQAPTGTLHAVLQVALPLLALLVIVGGGFGLFSFGRARRADDLRPLWPVSLPLSIGWAIAIAISGVCAAMRSEVAMPEHQSAAFGYGPVFGALLAIVLGLIAIPVGVVIARAGSRANARAG